MRESSSSTFGLALLAIGIVFGDIGTSPLYAFKAIFDPAHGIPLTTETIFGSCSCVFWALMLVVTLKYVTFILRATNNNEGGIMAMLALVRAVVRERSRLYPVLIFLGLVGAALFYGDAVLTPAISVLSAIEGLEIGSSLFAHYTVPIAVAIIIGLFAFQRYGTALIGHFFAPVCIVWFVAIAAVGTHQIIQTPEILNAFNPLYAGRFLTTHGWFSSFSVLGSILLAYTGAEALYADVGHFGRKAIRLAWFMIFPALVLSYFGQGALLIRVPDALSNPFYLACPEWALYPMVGLATLATIIASQAVISGTYSITQQAIQLHYLPRMRILHTSADERGQIYMPFVNAILLLAVLFTIMHFGTSSALANAYGIAVSGTMLTTTLLAFFVMRYDWQYALWQSLMITLFFGVIDGVFFVASVTKFPQGGWFPIAIAAVFWIVIKTWRRGYEILLVRRKESMEKLEPFLEALFAEHIHRVPGMAIFLCSDSQHVPRALMRNLRHNKIVHEHMVFLSIAEEDIPFISEKNRVQIRLFKQRCYFLTVRFGFKEEPNIARVITLCAKQGYTCFTDEKFSFFLSYEMLLRSKRARNMLPLFKRFFMMMARNQRSVAEYFNLSSEHVIQLVSQVEI